MWHGTWGWGHMAVGVLMILFWSVLVALVILLVRWFAARFAEQRRPVNSALQILEERFARGEIDRQEFEERRQLLAGGTGAAKGRST